MENKELAELKAYVFAQYWGQNVLCYHDEPMMQLRQINEFSIDAKLLKNKCLQLRSLSSLTDEQIRELGLLAGMKPNCIDRTGSDIFIADDSTQLSIGLYFTGVVVMYNGYQLKTPYWNVIDGIYQTLRQMGFALPVFFKGVQYRVERLVELGIIVLDK